MRSKKGIDMNIEICIANLLDNIKISADMGNKIALKGSNGSGKTTILKCLAGMCMPTKGKIDYDETASFTYPLNFMCYLKWTSYIKNNVFFIDGAELFYKDMSIEENIKYFTSMGSYNFNSLYEDLDRYKIEESLKKPLKLLSEGTKQKLLILFALHCKKKIILIDEPEKNLDKDSIVRFYKDLKNITDKIVIIATHKDLEEIVPTVNKIYEVNGGEVLLTYENIN